ncbi:MAG: plastocyanin/azurin family copper-binding protein [Gemmatimonadales bacterium]
MKPSHRTRTGLGILAAGTLVFSGATRGQTSNAGPANGHTVTVRMTDDMKFIPEHPTVTAGDTVVWVNEGSLPHTATDRPGAAGVAEHNVVPDGAEPWDSGLMNKGDRFKLVLTVPGDYTYLCIFHEAAGMIGKLTVQ